jgi:hypothetical protein
MTKDTFGSADRIVDADRHVDVQEGDMDERVHTTPWLHASDIPNVPARNPVAMGLGGRYGSRGGRTVARDRQLARGRARDSRRSSASCGAGTVTS